MIKLNSLPVMVKIGALFFALTSALALGIGFSSYRISRAVISDVQHEALDGIAAHISAGVSSLMERQSGARAASGPLTDKDKAALLQYLSRLEAGRNIFLLVATAEGEILYPGDDRTAAQDIFSRRAEPAIAAILKSGNGTATGTVRGRDCYVSVKTVPRTGWRVAAAIPTETYNAPLSRMKRSIALLSLIIGAAGIFAGGVAAYLLLTRPMIRLAEAVRSISKNKDFTARVPELNNDEIGSVAQAFNSVLAELSSLHQKDIGRSAEKLSSAEAQLRQAQKMEIVGRLAGGVAHDFNNLLTIIMANCTFLLNDIPEGDPRRDDVKEIRTAGERAATLTRQLLAFSRKQILQPKLIDLNAGVTDTQKIIKRLIGEDISIKAELEPGLPAVKADPGQIEQILMNLAVNARDAMPAGGVISFRTASLQAHPGARLEHSPVAIPPGKYVCLTVADTGTGISENTMAHLFEPFFTTKSEGKGTGLGLAMVYGIVKQSGGFVDVKSPPGSGAVFTIYLPSSAEAAPREEKKEITAGARKAHGTILLVEDDEALMRMTSRMLKGAGYQVIEAVTAHAALESLDKDFKLLLTDITLPDISGVELAARVLARRPGKPVIFTSGYSESEDIRKVLARPDNNFIQKPFSDETLLARVAEVIGKSAGQA